MRQLIFVLLAGMLFGLEVHAVDNVNGQRIYRMPIKKLDAAASNNGVVFLLQEGRYAITGQIYDVLQGKTLDSVDAIENALTTVKFSDYKVDVKKLNGVKIGTAEKEIVVFVDPLCSTCHQLLKEMMEMTVTYAFRIIVVPALGDKSDALAKSFYCASDRTKALNQLLDGTLSNKPVPDSCDRGNYDLTLLAAHYIGLSGVPFIVRDDGEFKHGRPTDLAMWLNGKD